MKLIKRFSIILIFILVIIIYMSNIDNKIYYVALGDSLAEGIDPYGKTGYGYSDYVRKFLEHKNILENYTKKFAKKGHRITDLIMDIENNKKMEIDNKKTTIKNALINADLVTISIGANDLFYKLGVNNLIFDIDNVENLYRYVDEIIIDMDKLIELIQKYCKEDIILVGYYNPLSNKKSLLARELEPIFMYINIKMTELANKYDIYYVDIYQIFKENPEYLPNPLDIHPSNEGYEVISREIISVIKQKILK